MGNRFLIEMPADSQQPSGRFSIELPPDTSYASKEDFLAADRVQPQPAPKDNRSWVRRNIIEPVLAPVEMATTMGTGMAGTLAGNLAGAVTGKGEPLAQQVASAMTYQPRTVPAKQGLEALGEAFNASKLPPMPGVTGLPAGAITSAVKPGMSLLNSANEARLAANAEALANKSRQVAPSIEAMKLAQKHGIVIDPARADPTVANKIGRAITGGENFNVTASNLNEQNYTNMARKALGVGENEAFTPELIKARKQAAASTIEPVRTSGLVTANEDVIDSIKSLVGKQLIGGKTAYRKTRELVDDTLTKLEGGMDAGDILDNIAQLRKDARAIYATQDAGRKKLAIADTSMGIANELENAVESHLTSIGKPELMQAYRNGRKEMAKIYTAESAIDMNTGKVHPDVIAKITKSDNALTGELKDIGVIAGNFPEVSKVGAKISENSHPHLTRSGIGGSIGAVAGSLMGNPVIGAVAGAGVGRLTEALNAMRTTRPGYQRSLNIRDNRTLREQMGYPQFAPPPEHVQMTHPTRAEFKANADAVRRAEIDRILQEGAASRANPAPNQLALQAAAQKAEIDRILQEGAASRARNQRK